MQTNRLDSCLNWHLMAWAAEPLDGFQPSFVEPGGLKCFFGDVQLVCLSAGVAAEDKVGRSQLPCE